MSTLLGQRLRSSRDALGLSQAVVAKAAGISQPYIAQVELGDRVPSTEVLQALARAVKTSAAWLMGDEIQDEAEIFQKDPRVAIMTDEQIAPGLRALANDEPTCQVLDIQRDEWVSLRSVNLKTPPDKDGYLLLLHAFRAICPRPDVTRS